MNTIVERLQEFLVVKNINVSTAESELKLANGTLSKPFNAKTNIKTNTLEKFLSKYTDISPDWLLTGTGSMLKSAEKPTKSEVIVATASESEGIPLIPLDAMAGYAQGSAQILELDCERFIVPTFRGADYLITVKGSSMTPKYNSGDIVACKNLPLSDIFFQWNKVYVLDTIQGPLIKRVEPGTDEAHIQLISVNENYKPFQLRVADINAIAIVIGVIRLE